MLAHLVARARFGAPLADPFAAAWLWPKLREPFPVVYGVLFMPNHLHIVGELPRDAQVQLGAILSGLTRHTGHAGPLWETAPTTRVPDRQQLQRQLRDVALNECRAGLSRDPLEAPWSTHRDVMGAVIDPWVTHDAVQRAVGWRTRDFQAAWHRYVTGDPCVAAEAAAMPMEEQLPLACLALAALAAHRSAPEALARRSGARRTFAHLAIARGWKVRDAAGACCISDDAVRKLLRKPVELDAATRCLDPRLHRRFEHAPRKSWEPRVSPGMLEHAG